MVQLLDEDIRTREVLDWNGTHLFHYSMSSCSQKTRIFLNLKGVPWSSHIVDLSTQQNWTPWFLGISPRGLVPVLVLDGAVHIESNDIMRVLERRHPEPCLIPDALESEIDKRLHEEDDLHLDLRNLSFRFVHGRTGSTKTSADLEAYRTGGTGTVRGEPDEGKDIELAYYERLAREGLTDAACKRSALKFRVMFDKFDARLSDAPYLLGDALTVIDIAWFVYAYRLVLGGYPLARLHPRVDDWYERLCARPEFYEEVVPSPALRDKVEENRCRQEREGATIQAVAGLKV